MARAPRGAWANTWPLVTGSRRRFSSDVLPVSPDPPALTRTSRSGRVTSRTQLDPAIRPLMADGRASIFHEDRQRPASRRTGERPELAERWAQGSQTRLGCYGVKKEQLLELPSRSSQRPWRGALGHPSVDALLHLAQAEHEDLHHGERYAGALSQDLAGTLGRDPRCPDLTLRIHRVALVAELEDRLSCPEGRRLAHSEEG